jgi:hypothetical protein
MSDDPSAIGDYSASAKHRCLTSSQTEEPPAARINDPTPGLRRLPRTMRYQLPLQRPWLSGANPGAHAYHQRAARACLPMRFEHPLNPPRCSGNTRGGVSGSRRRGVRTTASPHEQARHKICRALRLRASCCQATGLRRANAKLATRRLGNLASSLQGARRCVRSARPRNCLARPGGRGSAVV